MILPIVIAAGGAVAVAVVGATLTKPRGRWYIDLKKPGWKPPDWLFGPAWTSILGMAAASAVLSWESPAPLATRIGVTVLFAFNGLLNIVWNILFFALRRPDWANIEVIALWLSIAALVVWTADASTTASLLMVPYLLWVTFASFLNLSISRMNAPFTTFHFNHQAMPDIARSDDAGRA